MTRPIQRVGHIGDTDNRFCGAPVFAKLAHEVVHPTDLLALGCGAPPLGDDDREVLRCITLATTTPDARVWPLKLSRVLASFGNVYAGHFGAQLCHNSAVMGPGTTSTAAASLEWLAARIAAGASIGDAVAQHLAERGKLVGFGVALRKQDERLLGLTQLLRDHPASTRPMFRLQTELATVIRAQHGLEPNVAIILAALMLDLGVPAQNTGLFACILMGANFAAHAIEAAAHDGPHLNALPPAAIEYRGRPARLLP